MIQTLERYQGIRKGRETLIVDLIQSSQEQSPRELLGLHQKGRINCTKNQVNK